MFDVGRWMAMVFISGVFPGRGLLAAESRGGGFDLPLRSNSHLFHPPRRARVVEARITSEVPTPNSEPTPGVRIICNTALQARRATSDCGRRTVVSGGSVNSAIWM